MLESHVYKPIFTPLRSKFKPLGVPVGKFFIILGICLLGGLIAFATGTVTHKVEVAYTSAEISTLTNEYTNTYTSLVNLQAQMESQGKTSVDELNLNNSQRETLEKADEYGLNASMTKDQVEALVPKTHIVDQPVVADFIRFPLLVALPFFVGVALFAEMNNTSAYREIKRFIRWYLSQKIYKNRPIDYVERVSNQNYWVALYEYQKSKNEIS